jgi:hypothetical protein
VARHGRVANELAEELYIEESPVKNDNTISDEVRLPLYLSSQYLQELATALTRLGIRARYERPGANGIVVPRLYVEHPQHGELSWAICATPLQLDHQSLEWWFEWRSFVRCGCLECINHELERICRIGDLDKAAQIIAEQLIEESA